MNNTFFGKKLLLSWGALVSKYGEAASALSCEMYDQMARAQNVSVPEALPAETASYGEVARAVRGAGKSSPSMIPDAVGRLVKQAGADTTLQNAKRDGAYFAWIAHGDTCPYCMALAGLGWQKAGKLTLKGGHAEHIHANCDCEYAIDHTGNLEIEGYDPNEINQQLLDMTDGEYDAESLIRMSGHNAKGHDHSAINIVRRKQYADNKDYINAQKRAAYAKRAESKSGIAASRKKEEWIGALAPDYRDEYGKIIKRGTDKMKHGFSCFSDDILDNNIKIGASKVEPKEGFFDVAMHGTPQAVCFGTRNEKNMSPRLLADLIKHHPDYNGENIRLLCCETGKTSGLPAWDYCFAEELSNCLGVVVEAPDDLVYIRLDGTWYVGTPKKTELVSFKPNQKGRYK